MTSASTPLAGALLVAGVPVRARAHRRGLSVGSAAVTALLLTGCQSFDTPSTDVAQVRVVAASPDISAVDFYAGASGMAYGLEFGSATTYISLPTGKTRLSANTSSSAQTLVTTEAGLAAGRQYTAVIDNVAASLQETVYVDQTTPAPPGQIAIRVINAATRSGSVDLYMVPAGSRPSSTNPIRTSLPFGASTSYVQMPAGSYKLVVTPAGSTQTSLTGSQVEYSSGAVRTIILIDRPNPNAPGVDEIVTTDYDPSQEARQ